MDSELSPYFYALRSNEEGRSVCGIVSCAPEQDTGIPERFLAAAARFPEAWEEAPEPLSKSVEHVSHQITALPDGPLLSSEQMQPVLLTLRKILAGLEPSVRMDVPESFLLADNPSAAAVRQKLRSIISSLQTSTVPDSDVSQIAQIQLYIAQNFESPEFSVGRLADQFSMPVSTLSSFFRGQTGESLSDYITRLKIERAKELLAYSTHTIGEIGMAVGYYSVSSFIRRFRSEVGMTPGEYREQQVR